MKLMKEATVPVYEYKCSECDGKLEVLKKISDPDPKTCDKCGGNMKKILFPAGIILKGPGFYHTEYGKGKKQQADWRNGSNRSDSDRDNGSASDKDSSSDDKSSKSPEADKKPSATGDRATNNTAGKSRKETE